MTSKKEKEVSLAAQSVAYPVPSLSLSFGFPLYALCTKLINDELYIAIGGGGGPSKTGVVNGFVSCPQYIISSYKISPQFLITF